MAGAAGQAMFMKVSVSKELSTVVMSASEKLVTMKRREVDVMLAKDTWLEGPFINPLRRCHEAIATLDAEL
jgi:hypothetical protein